MSVPLRELARLFLTLGTIGIGGPAVHIAMMEDEVVRRRRWLTREQFLDYIGAVNLIPGPNSTELAIHIGRHRAGTPGLLVAGICFILPAALIVGVIAWAYLRFGQLPTVQGVLDGVKPVVIAVVAQALWGLAISAIKSKTLAVLTLAAATATALGAPELSVLAGAGAFMAMVAAAGRGTPALSLALLVPPPALWPLFLTFLKIGSVLFGSGYVLLAFLRADFVERLGWLTAQQLIDAVAVGQMTPGPVFTTATFVGYLMGGPLGAVAATIGIFLPAFVFVAATAPLLPRLRRSRVAGAALDGVNVASLALMAVVTFQLASVAIVDLPTVAIAATAAVLLFRFRVNSAWLVLCGAMAGVARQLMN